MVDLNDKIVKVVASLQPISGRISGEANRTIVSAIGGGLTPGIRWSDPSAWQERRRRRMTVGAPPQS